MNIEKEPSLLLADIIAEIMLSKKANNVIIMNLKKTNNSLCDRFVICHGNSTTQIQTIRDAIIEEVRKAVGEKPWHVEGMNNSEWLLLDYRDVIVHIFLEKTRKFYNIEDLWADSDFTHVEDPK